MKKYLFLFSITCVLLFSLTGCKKNKISDIDRFLSNITESEKTFSSYDEFDSITDNAGMELYSRHVTFSIERAEEIKTSYQKSEKKFNESTATITSYKTIGDKKYVGQTESSYEVPNYFLSFAFNKDFLAEGYSLENTDGVWKLSASILDDKMSNFFVSDNLNLKDLTVQLEIKEDKLTRFEANYSSAVTNNKTKMIIIYSYDAVTIE